MEKKATANDDDEASMCRKLFNVFVPAGKLDRRVAVVKQEAQQLPELVAAGKNFREEEEEKVIGIQSMERPAAAKLRGEKQRRSNSLNERAENYIARTKMKLRVGSAIGRHSS